MRLLLVSHEYPPETGWGGIGTYAGTIAPALAELGAEVHVLAVGHVQSASSRAVDGVRVHRVPLRARPVIGRLMRLPETWRRATLAVGAARASRRLDAAFDVCEAADWGAEGVLLGGGSGPPLVVRLHSGAAQVFPFLERRGLDSRFAIALERRAIRRATLVTGTPAQLRYARETFGLPAARLRALSYPLRPIDAGDPPPSRDVLFLGRFEERKGPATLIRAMPYLLARVPDARLTLAGVDTVRPGGGSYRAMLGDLAASLGVAPHVELRTVWGRDAVAEELARAMVVAVPSRWESFGYTLAEAMSAGRAVVASAIEPFQDLVTDGATGCLVAPDDPEAWAASLAGLLEQHDRARSLAAAARAQVRERHDPATVARASLTAYEDAIALARG